MKNKLAIIRRFDAPLERVWRSWSEAERLARWWGPKGCTIEVVRLEFRPGGFFHYAMRFPGSDPMWGRFMYREIAAPGRIVWLNSFSNPGCGITRAPFDMAVPMEIQNDATFTEEGGKTLLTLKSQPHGAAEEEEHVFRQMFSSMQQGFGGTFDQLEEHLAGL
jgi:uncharacterized protein YndB with AHSA1/START domain